MSKHCTNCGTQIPAARLKALPTAQTCVGCSSTSKYMSAVVQIGSFEDDGFQDIDIIRNDRDKETYNTYYSQLGQYKNSTKNKSL